MKPLNFLEKTRELALYCDSHETITLFELTQLYGSSLAPFVAFLLSVPLLFVSWQWIALPLCFLIMLLAIVLLFDERIWLLDAFKRQTIPSPIVKKGATAVIHCLEWLKKWIPSASFYAQFETIFRTINPLLLILAALQVGFLQGHNASFFTAGSLLLVSLGAFTENGYISLAGYAAFFIALM